MRVIGHRGAASLAPENSIASIKAAIEAGVDAVEFDIRLSRDGVFFLCHDISLQRTHNLDKRVKDLTRKQLHSIRDKDGFRLPTLDEALNACGETPAIIEAKNGGWAKPLAEYLSKHPRQHLQSVISFNHHELAAFAQLCPGVPLYVLEHRNPFDAINAARIYGFQGIDVNYWTLNPLAYLLAWRHNLRVVVFTVDKPWIGKLLRLLYPGIAVTTNVPQKMQYLRAKKRFTKST